MVTLLFRKLSYSVHEIEGLTEIRKFESLRDVVLPNDTPPRHLLLQGSQFLTLEWWNPTSAGNAGLAGKLRHHSPLEELRSGQESVNCEM